MIWTTALKWLIRQLSVCENVCVCVCLHFECQVLLRLYVSVMQLSRNGVWACRWKHSSFLSADERHALHRNRDSVRCPPRLHGVSSKEGRDELFIWVDAVCFQICWSRTIGVLKKDLESCTRFKVWLYFCHIHVFNSTIIDCVKNPFPFQQCWSNIKANTCLDVDD